jgi:predicted GH43/DUF377 family glycosyl hydrolase
MVKFSRHSERPVMPRVPGTFRSIHVANPDLLEFNDMILMFYRGQGNERHDQIGVAYSKPGSFDGVNWSHHDGNPIIPVDKDRKAFDCRHILDPAAVEKDGRILLYYSGHSYDKPSCIGLAVSVNGYDFEKKGAVIENAFAPEVVIKDGKTHLFYQRKVTDHFEFFKCESPDGQNFDLSTETVVFSPSEDSRAIDKFSLTTCRIWFEESTYFMTYGMGDRFDDYPPAFGLAKSKDLINWERYPDNPIFERGETGSWDEGAIWFGTVYKHNDIYYMWYEGTGAGLGTDSVAAARASDICRNNDYGGYAEVSFSQIGLATYKGRIPSW